MTTTTVDRSLGELFAELSRKMSILIQKEVALAQTELSEKAAIAGRGIGLLAAGGVVIYTGALFILAAIAILLAGIMPAWLAVLLVGAIVAIIGVVLVSVGRSALKSTSLKPEQTLQTLQEDKEWVQQLVK